MARRTSSKDRDIVTLADLAPRHRVTGGSQRVFGAGAPAAQRDSKKPGSKDLSPTTSKVKGGRLAANDNLTLVRSAKPATKDLPAGKDIKAGKKTR